MKQVFIAAALLMSQFGVAQIIDIDLAEKKSATINLDLETKSVRLLNMSKVVVYTLTWKKTTLNPPPFDNAMLASNDGKLRDCSPEIKSVIETLDSDKDEANIKKAVETGRALIKKLGSNDCTVILEKSISETEKVIDIPLKFNYNQEITLTIQKKEKAGKDLGKWSYLLKTEEKTRWLTHYGLTYSPSIISKTDNYYAFADTSTANKYTIRKENENGPKPWDNISATINFTYPFSSRSRNLDFGFTAGFGLNPGFQLSGHTGLSAIIGTNVIIGTGVAFMQKNKLRGQYEENQVIKTNLDFDALHHKVWLPELYLTIGFRFSQNPFAKKDDKEKAEDKPKD